MLKKCIECEATSKKDYVHCCCKPCVGELDHVPELNYWKCSHCDYAEEVIIYGRSTRHYLKCKGHIHEYIYEVVGR